jgi:hypothetical protein
MAFEFSFDPDNNLVYIKASISIDFVSITEAMKALLSDQRLGKQMGILVDIRDVNYVISEPEILTLLSSPIWRAMIDGHKVATVAGKPAHFLWQACWRGGPRIPPESRLSTASSRR